MNSQPEDSIGNNEPYIIRGKDGLRYSIEEIASLEKTDFSIYDDIDEAKINTGIYEPQNPEEYREIFIEEAKKYEASYNNNNNNDYSIIEDNEPNDPSDVF